MKSLKALCALFLIAFASPVFGIDFVKIPGLQGETKDPAHAGWIELKSWNWVGANPALKGTVCNATNEASFMTSGGSPNAEAGLMHLCGMHQQLPQLTIDIGGQRHVLNQVTLVHCMKSGLEMVPVTVSVSIRFHDCASHIAPIQAQIVGETVPLHMVKLLVLRFAGKDGTIILQPDFGGGGGSSFFTQASASKQLTPQVSIKANNQTWTFTDMVVSSFSSSDGKQTFRFSFNTVSGPPGGYQRP